MSHHSTHTKLCYGEVWVSHKDLVHHAPKGVSSPSSISRVGFHLPFPNLPSASSASPIPVPGSHVQLPFGPHLIWGESPCHRSPCSISLFLLALNLTSCFTQQDLGQAKLFLNSCLAIIHSTPGDSWTQTGKPEGTPSC